MDNTYHTTEHRKGQHLTDEERHEIEVRINKDGWSIYKIAESLARPYNTIKNEVNRGTVFLYNGKIKRYKANAGKAKYEANRKNCRRKYRRLEVGSFIRYVVKQIKEQGWSLDSCVGNALKTGRFHREDTVCTKTLYNYVSLGLLTIKNIDLPEKLRRKQNKSEKRRNRKNLGHSIEERPDYIDLREEFGHWEIDSVIGKKDENEPTVMTMTERKLRVSIWLKLKNHSAEAVDNAISELIDSFGSKYADVFKSITADNGSEFANLSNLDQRGIKVYFTHPYTSCEKGTVECHNKLLRRFIPKGKKISDYSADDILFFADLINNLPRKILRYQTPEELFNEELDRIYAA